MNTINFLITFFTIFILALMLSVDDFTVGIAYGLFGIRLTLKSLIIIILGSATSTYGIMLIGKFILTSMPDYVARCLSAIILGGIGCKMFYNGWKEKDDYFELVKKNPLAANDLKLVNIGETYLIGIGLGVDDFAEALGLSLAGFPIVLTVMLLEVAELIAILSGNLLAFKEFSKKIDGKLSIIPGIVLILVAIYNAFF